MGGTGYEKVLLFIAITVTILWGIAVIIGEAFPSHPVPSSVSQVMVIVATGFFGGSIIANIKKNGKD